MLRGDPSASGRVGLALSGGGFRASFYHLGVLARLADADRLREVEVVSAVSGGSVTAALYALHLRDLLASKPDEAITRDDYRRVVQRVGHDLRRAVRKNLRMRVFSNPLATLQMLGPAYSRSDRMADLYERHLYAGLGAHRPTRMEDFLVTPHGTDSGFRPDEHNEDRAAKVPVTLLNATVLNGGHNWRFEGVRMGVPDHEGRMKEVLEVVDKNVRFVRADSYQDLPKPYQPFPLKLGVAASTAVPGVFAPLSLSKLYPGARLQLVDGGVHDNQGVQGLLDRKCRRFWVSDASGLMRDEMHPKTGLVNVLSRANSVMAARMREEQLIDLLDGEEGHVALVHLLRGVEPRIVEPLPADGSPAPVVTEQRLLAHVRTDLDAFHDVEAYALADNGYEAIGDALHLVSVPDADWPFRKVDAVPEPKRRKLLRISASKMGKVLRVSVPGAIVGGLVTLAFLALFLGGAILGAGAIMAATGLSAFGLVGVAALYAVVLGIVYAFVRADSLKGLGAGLRYLAFFPVVLVWAVAGALITNVYILLLNNRYLNAGRVPGGDWPEPEAGFEAGEAMRDAAPIVKEQEAQEKKRKRLRA